MTGFSFVPVEGWLGFKADFEASLWGKIVVNPHLFFTMSDAELALALRHDQAMKLKIVAALLQVEAASVAEPAAAVVADGGWDRVERLLDLDVKRERLSEDVKRRDAAELLHGELLAGGGTAQTKFTYDDEVDFGRMQKAKMQQPAVAEAVNLLGLQARMQEIDAATEQLAQVLGRIGEQRAQPPMKRLNNAVKRCVKVCNIVYKSLQLYQDAATTDVARRTFADLLAPFDQLLQRHQPKPTPPATAPAEP
jgi:hypothetical protein